MKTSNVILYSYIINVTSTIPFVDYEGSKIPFSGKWFANQKKLNEFKMQPHSTSTYVAWLTGLKLPKTNLLGNGVFMR